MQTFEIEARAETDAPADAVWALLADVAGWSAWGAFDESSLERAGEPDPNGVGALRRFRTGRVVNVEEVVAFEPPALLAYVVRSTSIPMRDYRAEVRLQDRPGGGTTIAWRSTFRARRPLGMLIARRLRPFIADTAERLGAAAVAARSWLPAGFSHPLRVELATGEHLRPIRAADAEIDLPAVMGSRDRLWETYGAAWGWPPKEMTLEQDREDLAHHEREIAAGLSFNYAILDGEESELLGCVYIDPPDAGEDADAVASWWVVDARVGSELERELERFVPGWLTRSWPFRRVAFRAK